MGIESDDSADARRAAEQRARDERLALLDAEGEALTDLRPVGKVRIEGKIYDALAHSHLIEAGTPVRVSHVTMTQIKVRAV